MKTDQELVQDLKLGNEDAFALLYERYSSALLHHLLCMTGKKEIAEELLHEVFITLIKKINFYEERTDMKNSFKAWLYRIATNRAIDEIRKTKNVQLEEAPEETRESLEVADELILQERSNKIQNLLNKLPLSQRTFLNLKLNEDLGHFEIAQICCCNVNAVKQGLFQARRSLKNLLITEGVEV